MRTTVPRILTGSYGRWRRPDGLIVRTSLGRPKWFPNEGYDLPQVSELTPTGAMLGSDTWAEQYAAKLERFGPSRIARALAEVADEYDVDTLVLACFEGDPADCHRGVFARWWTESTGEPVFDLTEVTR